MKDILRAIALGITLATTSVAANAVPIVATFSGTVSNGARCDLDGCISLTGERVSASVTIDTDSAPANYYGSHSEVGLYQTYGTGTGWLDWQIEAGGESLHVASVPFDYLSEYLYVIDRADGLDYVEAYSYGYHSDYDAQTGTTTDAYRYLDVYVYDYIKEFVSGPGLLQFGSVETPYYGYGSYYTYLYEYDSQGLYSQYGYHYASFYIDTLTVGDRVEVAEPSTLSLLWLALGALGATLLGRRRAARARVVRRP